MSDIFISYKREDVSLARSLAERLEKEGWSVWWDHEIPAGRDYDTVIETELEQCKCVIVLWTPSSTASRNVKDEANVGLKYNKLLPVMVGKVQPPLGFRMVQAIQWNDNNIVEKEEMENLKEQVRQMMTGKPMQPRQVKARLRRSYRKGWLWAGGIIGFILLLFIIPIDPEPNPEPEPEPVPTEQKTAEEYFEAGAHLADNKQDYDGAIDQFNKALTLNPGMAAAYYGRGTAYNLKGMNTRAITDLNKSIELGFVQAYSNLGWTYFDLADYMNAITCFNYYRWYYQEGVAEAGAAVSFFVLGELDSARVRYDNAIAIDRRFDGNFEALTSAYHFNDRQFRALKSTYSRLYNEQGMPSDAAE